MQTNTDTAPEVIVKASPTAAIRTILSSNPDATVKEILARIAEEHPSVNTHYRFVYNTLKRLRNPKAPAAASASLAEQIAGVREHATANYTKGGWDVIVESWTDEEIGAALVEEGTKTVAGAIRAFQPVVSVWAERQADAIHSAF